LSILFIFSKKQLFVLLILCMIVFVSMSVDIHTDRYVVNPIIWLFLLFKDLIVCSWINATLWLRVFIFFCILILSVLPGFVCFHLLCSEFLVESSVVVAWCSYIVLVSVYCGRLLFLHQFWMIVLLSRMS
jgi:hypothetical protein